MFAQESVMEIQKESEAFEAHIKHIHPDLPDAWYKRDENGRYPEGMQQDWELWQAATAQVVSKGFVLINAESLALHAQSIRMFNNGGEENYYYEIENHVCAIEAMIEAQEQK